ncbi:MAG TPA: phenylalanine--tRNA ligase subunit beta, partial [Candidatus Paceibacterota bacterium]|nr:phenylalanine--tRNA ligase subunit beta [Candidatus Paceibacterota bacterium]
MKISKNWLQNFFDGKLPATSELCDAITFHAFEIDGVEGKGGDDILDIKVTPNRGHDALSHRGIAKEVSAILKMPIKADIDPMGKGFADRFAQAPRTDAVSITLEDPALSPRYIAAYIKGVKVGPSPEWLKSGLEAIGQRSINNIVDATNLVMFNLGQPMHAFDAGKLEQKGGRYHIVVRRAKAGEKLLALDQKEYALDESTLVIADGNRDEAVGIAGIKGGTPAGITEATTDLILEAANFNGTATRKSSQQLKLRTDASARFEQGVSPELCAYAMENAIEIIKSIAGGELVSVADVYPSAQKETRVKVSVIKINRTLGSRLTGADVADVFSRLGFSYKEEGDEFEVVAPAERLDIMIPEDLIEEVGRIIGYDKIAGVPLPPPERAPETNANYLAAEKAREELAAQGYSEVYTSVFAEEGERAVLNKADSVRPFMRTSLISGLESALKKNIPNKDLLGLKEVKLFEIGAVWKGGKEVVMLGTIGEKEQASEKPLDPQDGKYENYPLSKASQFAPFSKYPYIVRDIALWVPKEAESSEVEAMIRGEAGALAQRIAL